MHSGCDQDRDETRDGPQWHKARFHKTSSLQQMMSTERIMFWHNVFCRPSIRGRAWAFGRSLMKLPRVRPTASEKDTDRTFLARSRTWALLTPTSRRQVSGAFRRVPLWGEGAVIDRKKGVVVNLGRPSAARCRYVGIDLLRHSLMALGQAGFDTAMPTAWLAEGLLVAICPHRTGRTTQDDHCSECRQKP